MWNFLTSAEMYPFSGAVLFVAGLVLLEIIALMLGGSIFGMDSDGPDLDAADIDPTSLRLGRNNAELAAPTSVITKDYDDDGDIDYIFGFRIQDTGVTCADDQMEWNSL